MNKKKSRNFVNARLRHIMDRPAPDYPEEIPFYRGEHIYNSFDFGKDVTVVDMFKTRHIACYMVVIDGELWSYKAGMNKIHAEIRRRNPPVLNV